MANFAEGNLGYEALLKSHPNLKEFLPFLQIHNAESPRGAVLVSASFIESQLHNVLAAFLIENKASDQILDGFNAPAGTFSAKIAFNAALGLISEKERRECDLIRRIRNKFAHSVHASFDDDAIANICFELNMRAKPYDDIEINAQGSFSSSVMCLALNLVNRPHYVSKHRLSTVQWPY